MAQSPVPSWRTVLWRGWRKRCPQCGQGALYQRWLKLHEHCPVCGLKLLANQGDLWGALVLLDRLLFLIPFIVLIYFRVWRPNQLVFYALGGGMVAALIFTMPHRNGVGLAFDYLIRRQSGELKDQAPPKGS